MLEAWRSDSPERYTYHSNFRRPHSQLNSPSRHSSLSPDRFQSAKPPVGGQQQVSLSRCQARSHASSLGSSQLPSYGPSRNTSGRSSPTRRRGSTSSRTASPKRSTPSQRQQQREHGSQHESHHASRSESQLSHKHSLDSEKLYKNLESISRRGSTARTRTAVNSSANTLFCNSGDVSPFRNGHSRNSFAPQGDPQDSRLSPYQNSWKGSVNSLLSPPHSHCSTTSRRSANSPSRGGSLSPTAITETDRGPERNTSVRVDRSGSNKKRGMDSLLIAQPKKTADELEEVCPGYSYTLNVRLKYPKKKKKNFF